MRLLFDDASPAGADQRPLIIDSFAGGGGASTGIELALGRSPDIAINHCEAALAMHAANHPDTLHLPSDVWALDIRSYTLGRPVGLLWASPDCTHFSRARGGKPTSKRVRGLAWVIVEFCQKLGANRPRVICLENVEEFQTWEDFGAWKAALASLGYKMEFKVLHASDYGAPTTRKRLYMVARRDKKPIVWPAPTHGNPRSEAVQAGDLQPWQTAADIIDWSIPCHSIFLSKQDGRKVGVRRPLVPNTMARIAAGIKKYVIDAKEPFVLNITHGGRLEPVGEPLRTITAARRGEKAVVVPTLIQTGYGERAGQAPRVPGLEKPLGTVVAGGTKHALVAAFLAQHNLGVVGRAADAPLSTVTTTGSQQAIVTSSLVTLRGTSQSQIARSSKEACSPVPTISSGGTHVGEVRALLMKYYGTGEGQGLKEPLHTVTTRDRYGLVTVDIRGEQYAIADIGMRMLTSRELYRAQGFPDEYDIAPEFNGKPLTKEEQVAKCGNSVCPPVAQALIAANCSDMIARAA